MDPWVKLVDLEPAAYSTHSLRRPKVALVYKKTGNLQACRLRPLRAARRESSCRERRVASNGPISVGRLVNFR